MIVVIPTCKQAQKIRKSARSQTKKIALEQDCKCVFCGKIMNMSVIGVVEKNQSAERPTIEHIKAVGKGGVNVRENLCVIHYKCNQYLNNLTQTRHGAVEYGFGSYH